MSDPIISVLNYIRNFPLYVKILAIFIYPIGTFIVIAYFILDSILYKSHLEYELENNMSEETVRQYAEFILSKHLTLGGNTPSYWNRKRSLWYRVNGNCYITCETKELFLDALKKQGVRISDERIIDNYIPY